MSTVVEIPVQAWFEGDFLTFLVVLESSDTVAAACEKVADGVVGRRFAPRPGVGYSMTLEDGSKPAAQTLLAEIGLRAGDYVVVGFAE